MRVPIRKFESADDFGRRLEATAYAVDPKKLPALAPGRQWIEDKAFDADAARNSGSFARVIESAEKNGIEFTRTDRK